MKPLQNRFRAIATGNFDGVHLGHQKIFDVLKQVATEMDLDPCVLAYEPHTRHVLGVPGEPTLLTPIHERGEAVRNLGLCYHALPFNKSIALLSGLDYVREVIIGKYQAKAWVFGEDHRFGFKGEGDIAEVQKAFPDLKIYCVAPRIEQGSPISSSRIRDALSLGDVQKAAEFLGREYSLSGEVVHGEKIGRTIGFPTANIKTPDFKHLPAFGVYAGEAIFGSETHRAVVNIGIRPTFAGLEPRIEIHIPNWSGDLYGQKLEMKLNLYLRGELRFNNVSELKSQIACDVQRALSTN